MKAYKAFNRDMTCTGFKYEERKEYKIEGDIELCEKGFHFCKDLVLTLSYYPVRKCITENRYAEVEILGEYELEQPNKHKGVTNHIKIVRVLSDQEVLGMIYDNNNSGHSNTGNHNSGHSNTGDYNSGHYNSGNYNSGNHNSGDRNSGQRNSGDRNSGDRNSGQRNSGDRNSGYSNTGDRNSGQHNSGVRNSGHYNSGNGNSGSWNTCNNETGFFNNSERIIISVFNRECLLSEWENCDKPNFIYFKIDPKKGYKGSFIDSYNKASDEDKRKIFNIPNFDKDVFFDISGIDVSEL